MRSLNLEEKVAQLFMVGSDTPELLDEIEPFLRYGLGGVLLFRHHLQPFDTAVELRAYLSDLTARIKGSGLSFMGIDQEGGQIERLPHWLFPTGLMPVVYGLLDDPAFCYQVNLEVAQRLQWLGINLNFTPTVDLNTERMNPIIGARAYGQTADQVMPFTRAVIKAHLTAGVLPVAKHFPGHGSGTVDSHLDLPYFEAWQEEELIPYKTLIDEGVPGVLVAHGLYPQLSKNLGERASIPASLSKIMIQHLLREQLGFHGLIFTDDLMMGAIWNERDPIEVAVMALEAGADMLVYRRAQPEAWQVFEAMVSRVQQGKFPESLLDQKIERILAYNAQLKPVLPLAEASDSVSEAACHQLALTWAKHGLVELQHQFISPLPLSPEMPWALVAPDRQTMPHYALDRDHCKDLIGWCREYGIPPQVYQFYPVPAEMPFSLDTWENRAFHVIVFMAFNSLLSPQQQQYYEQLRRQHPEAKMIVASCGMPTDSDVLSNPWIHLQMPSLRPAALQAFAQWLVSEPKLFSEDPQT